MNVFKVEVYGQTHPQPVVFSNVTTVRPTWPPTPPPIRGKATVRGVQLHPSVLRKCNFYTLILKKRDEYVGTYRDRVPDYVVRYFRGKVKPHVLKSVVLLIEFTTKTHEIGENCFFYTILKVFKTTLCN